MAFNEAQLDNHSGLAGPSFLVESTIMSNGSVKVPKEITIDDMIVSSGAATWDRVDAFGNKYEWLNGNSTPGGFSGNAPAGGQTSYTIQDDDDFLYQIFNRNGFLLPDPDVNVTKYVPPPQLDYAAMKAAADLDDPTWRRRARFPPTACTSRVGSTSRVISTSTGRIS